MFNIIRQMGSLFPFVAFALELTMLMWCTFGGFARSFLPLWVLVLSHRVIGLLQFLALGFNLLFSALSSDF